MVAKSTEKEFYVNYNIQKLQAMDVADLSLEDIETLNSLFRQLSEHFSGITRGQIQEIARENVFFVARNGSGSIVGTVTLICFRQPMGLVSRAEDLVVDFRYRGHGIGEKLFEELKVQAAKLGMKQIDLTTNPARKEANRLYARVGFTRRETNVFVLYLPEKEG